MRGQSLIANYAFHFSARVVVVKQSHQGKSGYHCIIDHMQQFYTRAHVSSLYATMCLCVHLHRAVWRSVVPYADAGAFDSALTPREPRMAGCFFYRRGGSEGEKKTDVNKSAG